MNKLRICYYPQRNHVIGAVLTIIQKRGEYKFTGNTRQLGMFRMCINSVCVLCNVYRLRYHAYKYHRLAKKNQLKSTLSDKFRI